jgi:Holin of 3TMs, for gene-transfer release
MDWKSLGQKVIGLGAPILGTALLGPGAGTAVGSLVAGLFGVKNDPSSIDAAIQADPQAATRLIELQFNHQERLAELALDHAKAENERELGIILEVNKTMREETKSEHPIQYSWRPFWGFISGGAFFVVCVFVCILGWRAITKADQNAIAMIPLLIGAFTTLFSIPGAILGITAWGRNKMKQAAVKDSPAPL